MTEEKKYLSSSVLSSIFKRKGGEGKYTKLNANLHLLDIEHLHTLVKATNTSVEDIIIASIVNKGDTFFLTTKYLVVANDSSKKIDLADVTNAKAIVDRNIKRNEGEFYSEMEVVYNQTRQRLKVEGGSPFFGLLNILMSVSAKNQV